MARAGCMQAMHKGVITQDAGKGEAGATLLQAMLTIVITGILLVLGIPGLQERVLDARRDGLVGNVVAGLNFARSEAIRRGCRITACPSADGLRCNGDTHWETGWIVFADINGNGERDSQETILRRQDADGSDGTLRGARTKLAYQSTGIAAGYTDTIRACDQRGTEHARSVIISNTGRVRVQRQASRCP